MLERAAVRGLGLTSFEVAEFFKKVAEPVEQRGPADDRRAKHDAVGNGIVLSGHAVLCSVRQQDEHEDVRRSQRSEASARDDAQEREEHEVHDRPADEDLQPVFRLEHALPVDCHGDVPPALGGP